MTPTIAEIEQKPNNCETSTPDLENILSRLHERERKFIFNYHTAKSKTQLVRLCGYSTANPSVIIRQLLGRAEIAQALKMYEESEQKRIAIQKEINGINKDSILLGLKQDVAEATRVSDRVTARLAQAKILGITKDTVTVNTGIFQQFAQPARSNTIEYNQVNDTTPSNTSTYNNNK
ncbi:MAG: hypothetical protein WC444_07350 [Candidatus Paceibacterota bacterium]